MKRQTIRKLMLLFSFALFPITVIYLAPAPPIMSLKDGVINTSVVVLTSIFVSGFIFRRAFCGWICPGAGCQLIAPALNNKTIKETKTNWFRTIMVVVWVAMMLATIIFNGIKRVELGYPGAGRFATSTIRYFLPYIPVVVFIIIFVQLFGRRGFCQRGCWLNPVVAASTVAGRKLRVPSLHVESIKSQDCSGCKICTKNCPMSIDVYQVVDQREQFPNHCVQCGTCIDSCPKDVLAFAFRSQPQLS